MPGTKAVSGMQEVVRLAKQANVHSIRSPRSGKGFDVVELEKRTGIAAPAIGRNERAPPAVAIMSFSPHRDGYVTPKLSGRHWAELGLPGLCCFD